ncbi:PGF-CTERM protein [Halohasta litchfieldiae]|jgi:PGF-CTERM protein|uniref:PGF-CTERM protein n=1 Tax=Halohasta litchfieldiae TaxID=1073996 RepID=A0A1H6QWV8_9EURY|nr:PGF-CTERM sorting domain-containing protein [Halohasta litchfieldiae]ATW88599.1 PGF-CTERM protein [Halohasta litchfieldiae]SEI48099.1 PGF-CTERM protein [Halohasta litchfieldiae]
MDRSAEQQRPAAKRGSFSRRGFIAGSAGIAATAVVPSIASAQNDSDGDDIEPVFTDVAISTTVPTLSGDDYTGLFMQVVNVEATEGIDVGVESCDILASDAEIMAYETRLIDRIEEDRQSTSAIIYAEEGNEEIHEGKLFVVDSQRPCPESFMALRLERVGAVQIGPEDGETGSTTPGFGVGAAVVGLGSASVLALRRRLQAE